MNEQHERPDPDELLRGLQPQQQSQRGRLKIFFGACAGVGKTYAMLTAAHEKREDGIDVLAGVAETHGRPETKELLKDMPQLPLLESEYRGVKLTEFDLDGALRAKPALILVDEYAHTNAPGSRHPKRWMDIEELLDAGIDVYTTLNVQHLESLNDVVAGITGIQVRETVPDFVFDRADDITLVDIPSGELLERLSEGKVYITPLGKQRAAENFFRKENLIALRELALRRTAERVDAQKDVYENYAQAQRRGSERLAVCIGSGDLSPRLIRATKRLADALRAPWFALYVENARHSRLGQEALQQLEKNIRLAEQLGAQSEILHGEYAASSIIECARRFGITKLIAGKPAKPRWQDMWRSSLVDELIRLSGDIDVYVITGEETSPMIQPKEISRPLRSWQGYTLAVLCVVAATAIGLPFREYFKPENLVMFYLAGVAVVAVRHGWAASMLGAILSVLAYNFFFTQPYYSFSVYSFNDILTLVILMLTSILIGSQTSRLHQQSRFYQSKERHSSALYAMSHELAATRGRENLISVICRRLENLMDGLVMLWLPNNKDALELANYPLLKTEVKEESVARWAFQHKQAAGLGTMTMPGARGYYLPLLGSSGALGALGFIPQTIERRLTSEERDLLETFAALAASALERAAVTELAEQRKVETETEKLRNTLLSSVSHDLRTPLASIKGAISSLLMDESKLDAATKHELLQSAHDEMSRLEKIVSNLLDVSLLESGALTLKRDYYFVPELIGNALKQVEPLLIDKKVSIEIESNLLPVWVDGTLMTQVFTNLLENAAKYTPEKTEVTISSKLNRRDGYMQIVVEDNGPGIPKGQEEKIFDKFMSLSRKGMRRGTGLGLAICRGIMKAHGGTIKAGNRKGRGAAFVVTLPLMTSSSEIRQQG
jgi:two-component system sensor histidine kinase KdpD